MAVTTALLFGVVPAFRAGRVEPSEALKEHGRTVAGERTRMLGQPLVVLQVALSLVLVVGAGLFLRTFAKLATIDLGFDRDPLLIVKLDLQRGGVAPDERLGIAQRLRGGGTHRAWRRPRGALESDSGERLWGGTTESKCPAVGATRSAR